MSYKGNKKRKRRVEKPARTIKIHQRDEEVTMSGNGTPEQDPAPPSGGNRFLKGLKSFVFNNSGGDEAQPAPAGDAEAATAAEEHHAPPPRVISTLDDDGDIPAPAHGAAPDSEMQGVLLQVLTDTGISSYTRFQTLMDAMKEAGLPESMRLKSALAAAKAQGIIPRQVLADIALAEQTLDEHARSFKGKAEERLTARVKDREEQAETLKSLIEQKRRQLAQLEKDIETMEGQEADMAGEITQEKRDHAILLGKYDATSDALRRDMRRVANQLKQGG